MDDLQTLSWPAEQLAEAVERLAQRSGLTKTQHRNSTPPDLGQWPEEARQHWIDMVARSLDIEAEPISAPCIEVDQLIRNAAPAILRLPDDKERFLLLLPDKGRQQTVALLRPDLKRQRLPVEVVRSTLTAPFEVPLVAEIEHVLEAAEVAPRRRAQAKEALLRQRLGKAQIEAGWLLRLPPGAKPWPLARQTGLVRHLPIFVGAYAVQYLLFILSWIVIGRGALRGQVEIGWLLAWGLILLTLIPFRLLSSWAQGLLAVSAGTLLKQRLLSGVLKLEPDEIRHQGVGQLLGRVIESEAVESLALSGGFLGLVALIELVFAGFILSAGAGGSLHIALFIGWLLFIGMMAWRYYRRRRQWTDSRLDMTHDLVERMVGHRTRLAQEAPDQRHQDEDQALVHYLIDSHHLDQTTPLLTTLAPRGWLVLGLIGLAPAFVNGAGTIGLAVGLGGVLLAWQAFRTLTESLSALSGAAIAWRQVAQLFYAAARAEPTASATALALTTPAAAKQVPDSAAPLLAARDLTFAYLGRNKPVLQQCDLTIQAGDRILLKGPSGSGKSTLASLLMGLRRPQSGLLLLHGLDRPSAGLAVWRRAVATAPQFHENHVLTETFAFNLLMGRNWPPRPEDMQAAWEICQELGLGELLTRMPAGMLQMVGETGWQLSHGERSRLYIARALLQKADLIVLDESFAALDPENLRRALTCVLERAPTLLVIAHP
jgi:ATP-binding cassette subfamily B protein